MAGGTARRADLIGVRYGVFGANVPYETARMRACAPGQHAITSSLGATWPKNCRPSLGGRFGVLGAFT